MAARLRACGLPLSSHHPCGYPPGSGRDLIPARGGELPPPGIPPGPEAIRLLSGALPPGPPRHPGPPAGSGAGGPPGGLV